MNKHTALSRTVGILIAVIIIIAFAVGAFLYLGQQAAPAPEKKLIIYHWWTAGGEKEAITSVYNVFGQKYKDVEIVENPVAGGAGAVMKAVIWGLLAAGTPPDTFQVHAGGELKEYVDAGYLQPVDDIWRELNLEQVIPGTLQSMCKFGGRYYAVPINVHRSNVLWYNPKIFNALGITNKFGDPRTWDMYKLLEVARYIKQQRPDVAPLALATRTKWPLTHLFEDLLALHGGPEIYVKFWIGQFNYNDPNDPVVKAVREVLSVIGTMVKEGLVNSNHPELEWDQAAALVMQGKAAMYIHGDWVAGYFIANNAKYGEDWGAAPFPKTIFIVLSDSFNLPKNAPHAEIAKNWLRVVGSKEAQEAFNLIKGSIPARVDVSPSYPDPYRPETAQDFKTSTMIPSAVHGGITKEAFVTEMHNILTAMITAISTGTSVENAVNAAIASILSAVPNTGLPSFWTGVTVDYFISRPK